MTNFLLHAFQTLLLAVINFSLYCWMRKKYPSTRPLLMALLGAVGLLAGLDLLVPQLNPPVGILLFLSAGTIIIPWMYRFFAPMVNESLPRDLTERQARMATGMARIQDIFFHEATFGLICLCQFLTIWRS